MFYLVRVDTDTPWGHSPEYPSVGNHYELIETDDIDNAIWELQCSTANNHEGQEITYTCNECDEETDYEVGVCSICGCESFDVVEEEWGEFVERVTSASWVEYNSADPVHQEHKGFEEKRPEHLLWKKKKDQEDAVEELNFVRRKRVEFLKEIERLQNKLIELDVKERIAEELIWELTDE